MPVPSTNVSLSNIIGEFGTTLWLAYPSNINVSGNYYIKFDGDIYIWGTIQATGDIIIQSTNGSIYQRASAHSIYSSGGSVSLIAKKTIRTGTIYAENWCRLITQTLEVGDIYGSSTYFISCANLYFFGVGSHYASSVTSGNDGIIRLDGRPNNVIFFGTGILAASNNDYVDNDPPFVGPGIPSPSRYKARYSFSPAASSSLVTTVDYSFMNGVNFTIIKNSGTSFYFPNLDYNKLSSYYRGSSFVPSNSATANIPTSGQLRFNDFRNEDNVFYYDITTSRVNGLTLVTDAPDSANVVNLATAGWNRNSRVIVTVKSGVTLLGGVDAISTFMSALRIDGFYPKGIDIVIESGAIVQGYGGKGGNGASVNSSGTNGDSGGTAIYVGFTSSRVRIYNYGTVRSGGGGGGGGGAAVEYASTYYGTVSFGYGGGGGGRGAGGTNTSLSSEQRGLGGSGNANYIAYPFNGQNGQISSTTDLTAKSGGAGGSYFSSGGSGGSGGNFGSSGQNGINAPAYFSVTPATFGGASGFALYGNFNVDIMVSGTFIGSLTRRRTISVIA